MNLEQALDSKYENENLAWSAVSHSSVKPKVVVLSGFSGCGKTTICNRLQKDINATTITNSIRRYMNNSIDWKDIRNKPDEYLKFQNIIFRKYLDEIEEAINNGNELIVLDRSPLCYVAHSMMYCDNKEFIDLQKQLAVWYCNNVIDLIIHMEYRSDYETIHDGTRENNVEYNTEYSRCMKTLLDEVTNIIIIDTPSYDNRYDMVKMLSMRIERLT